MVQGKLQALFSLTDTRERSDYFASNFSVGAFAAGSGGDYLFLPSWIASCQLRSGEYYAVVGDG